MPKLVDANLEIFKKTAYKALSAIWVGIVISTTLPFLFNPSYATMVLGSIIGGVIIVIASYMLLISVKLKRTKEIGIGMDTVLKETEKAGYDIDIVIGEASKGEKNGKK